MRSYPGVTSMMDGEWRGIYAFCVVRGEWHISKVEKDRRIVSKVSVIVIVN